MTSVVLCVCTCRRPAGLARLLEAVAELDDPSGEVSLSVVVVDNDADRAGLAVCRRMAATYRWPLAAAFEPERGISYARNRAVALALERAPDFIAMLDDDERPCGAWLRELLRVQAETGADAVGGPVFPDFAGEPTDWMRRPGLFGVPQQPDRARVVLYAAGNFIARAACFHALLPAPFDPRFALTGGEDLVFFGHLRRLGCSMTWAADAHVFETVPPGRMSLAWLKRRQYRLGNLNVRVQRMFAPGPRDELVRLAKTAGLLVLGALLLVSTWPHRLSRVRAILMIWYALGKIAGHAGVRRLEYTEIHGG